MKPIKQMKIELGLKAIREENEEIADRRRKRIAKKALDVETELQLVPGTPSTRGPFYSNRAMRRFGLRGSAARAIDRGPIVSKEQDQSELKTYTLGDMLRAVRGLRRKTG